MDEDLPWLMRRAEQEAILAAAAIHPIAAAAHDEISRRYSANAVALFRTDNPEPAE